MGETVHVVPIDDLIVHDTDGSDCICGPSIEFVEGDGDGWLVVHSSLDSREFGES